MGRDDDTTPVTGCGRVDLGKPRMRGWLHTYAFFVAAVVRHRAVLAGRDPPGRRAVGQLRDLQPHRVRAVRGQRALPPSGVVTARLPVMRRLDHSMIFIFIAGTYTPFSRAAAAAGRPTVILADGLGRRRSPAWR